jgi:CheY-like chemotaxis protein
MKPTVLLVEDEPDIRLIARASLVRAGFDVITAGSGVEALDAVAAQPPDLILLDWMLPDLDGVETCRRLKGDPSSRSIPIVFLTAETKMFDAERCRVLGALGCIRKPFDPLSLGEQVKELSQRGADSRREDLCR